MNNRDIEAGDHQYHDLELPQYPSISSSADHDTVINDDYFELDEWLEMEIVGYGDMETDGDGIEPIEDELYRSLFESMETYEATTKPASKSAIEKLEKVRLESVEAARHAGLCAVCMEDFEAGNEATRLPCLHLYHRHCVVPWLEINHRCLMPLPHATW
ncbi:E3 ubiquitin-protein ligase RING1-like [Argentina anserina]|uniref:E3 ubiquitin-protein ligase RING1-like n=1 Tax=Argentina anserina TaxID=57926 RepID=UPI0021763B7F|nr:E3 ubiquitin-protein ligase RING1-like [Potentilla anserina]